MIPVNEAIEIVRQETPALESESVELSQATGRYLAEEIVADTDLPPFDRSQMDGYALRASDVQNAPVRLRVAGESVAGAGWHKELHAGEAVRIMTGAPVPAGADSVQQVELTHETKSTGGPGEVEILHPVELGRSIVRRGSEIKAGERVLLKGERISASMVAVLASFGYATVRVGKLPHIAVLATGSELVSVEKQPGPDQIRDSNNYSIEAYARIAGAVVERLPLAGDDVQLLKEQLLEAATSFEVVITSGGVSMGAYDFTKPALKQLDARIFFERVSLRPGKPTVFARLPSGTLVFGLPGNPVSVSVTFNLFVRTALLAMQGALKPALEAQFALLSRDIKGAAERESYLPARLHTDDDGHLIAEPLKWGGSSDFVSFARATALIVVPANVKVVEANSKVKVVRLP
jgi:molybdenum cofactor synthesis domain-containing protein